GGVDTRDRALRDRLGRLEGKSQHVFPRVAGARSRTIRRVHPPPRPHPFARFHHGPPPLFPPGGGHCPGRQALSPGRVRLPLLRRRGSRQQALRERFFRLHRDALLSSDAAGHAGRGPRQAPAPTLSPTVASRVERLELQEGFALVTAPRFRPCRSWADRLRLNGGIEREGRRVHPRSNWRPPTTRELSLLVRQDPGRESPLTRVPVSENPESAGL